jgi:hypothetical protein
MCGHVQFHRNSLTKNLEFPRPFDTSEAFSKGGVNEGYIEASIEMDDRLAPVHFGSHIQNVALPFWSLDEIHGEITLAVEFLRERRSVAPTLRDR